MARPRKFEEETVMQTIMELFWEKGYEATTVHDLVKATGLLKGSLYGAFGDKKTLYLAALHRYEQTEIAGAVTLLSQSGHAKERISRLFDAIIDAIRSGTDRRGCFLCNAGMEMAPVDQQIEDSVLRAVNKLEKAIESALIELDGPGKSRTSIARQILSAYFGARVIAKAGCDVQYIEDIKQRELDFLSSCL